MTLDDWVASGCSRGARLGALYPLVLGAVVTVYTWDLGPLVFLAMFGVIGGTIIGVVVGLVFGWLCAAVDAVTRAIGTADHPNAIAAATITAVVGVLFVWSATTAAVAGSLAFLAGPGAIGLASLLVWPLGAAASGTGRR